MELVTQRKASLKSPAMQVKTLCFCGSIYIEGYPSFCILLFYAWQWQILLCRFPSAAVLI